MNWVAWREESGREREKTTWYQRTRFWNSKNKNFSWRSWNQARNKPSLVARFSVGFPWRPLWHKPVLWSGAGPIHSQGPKVFFVNVGSLPGQKTRFEERKEDVPSNFTTWKKLRENLLFYSNSDPNLQELLLVSQFTSIINFLTDLSLELNSK